VDVFNKDIIKVKTIPKYFIYILILMFPVLAGGNAWFYFRSSTGIFIGELLIALTGLIVFGFSDGILKTIRKLTLLQWLIISGAVFYLLLNIVSMMLSIDIFLSEKYIFVYVSAIILLISTYLIFENINDIIKSLILLVISSSVVAAAGIYQTGYWFKSMLITVSKGTLINPNIITTLKNTFRAFGNFAHPNILAGFLIMIIPVSYMLMTENKKYPKYAFTALSFILTTGLFVTYSRAGIALYVLSLPLILVVLKNKGRVTHHILHIGTIALLSGIATMFIVSTYNNYNKASLSTKYDIATQLSAKDMSFITREHYAESALEIIRHNPWIGTGPNTFSIAMRPYQKDAFYSQYAHNNYLEIAGEIGIPGLIFYLIFLGSLIVLLFKGWRDGKTWAGILLISMIMFIIHTGIDFDYSSPAVVWTLFLFAGISLILGNKNDET